MNFIKKQQVGLSLISVLAGVTLFLSPSQARADNDQANCPKIDRINIGEQFKKAGFGFSSQIGDRINRKFIEEMIPHHKMAIAMAEVEISKGTDPEVKAIAEQIKSKQTAENEQLKNWYKQWYGSDPKEESMDMSMVEELKNSSSVDMMFVEMMIDHHKEAISMARKELMMGKRQELKDFAQMTINEQQKEIEEMEQMLEEMEG